MVGGAPVEYGRGSITSPSVMVIVAALILIELVQNLFNNAVSVLPTRTPIFRIVALEGAGNNLQPQM